MMGYLPLLAQRGRGTPRSALRLLESCRRVCRSIGENTIVFEHVEKACVLEGIDGGSLDRHGQLSLLRMLSEDPNGHCESTLWLLAWAYTCEDRRNVFEPYLLRLGLIERCVDGKAITARGWNIYRTRQSDSLDDLSSDEGSDLCLREPSNLQTTELAISVSEMARRLTLSRARFLVG